MDIHRPENHQEGVLTVVEKAIEMVRGEKLIQALVAGYDPNNLIFLAACTVLIESVRNQLRAPDAVSGPEKLEIIDRLSKGALTFLAETRGAPGMLQ